MSMTYYAVTDDPNELAHFGILGMKWGRRRTPEQLGHPRHSGSRNRSAAYKRAQKKLSSSMHNGINKVKASWKEYNSPENKQLRAEKRYDRKTDRAIQKARKGKLKYGKLDDWQVQRVTERLAMERDARSLAETEKTWGKRLRESIGEGIISGVGSGVGRITSEAISRRSILKTDRKRKEQSNEMDLEQQRRMKEQEHRLDIGYERQKMREEARNAKEKARNEVNAEYYKEAAKRGYNHPYLNALASGRLPSIQTNRERAKQLESWKSRNAEEERAKRQHELIDKSYYETMGRLGAEHNSKLMSGDSSKKSKKKKDKNKGPGSSQAPINIYLNNGRKPYSYSVEEERSNRVKELRNNRRTNRSGNKRRSGGS